MSGDQTPKFKPSFRNRSKRLSDVSVATAYRSPLLGQSPSPDYSKSTSSLPVNLKRPCHRSRLNFDNSSFRSPLLTSSSPLSALHTPQHSSIPTLKQNSRVFNENVRRNPSKLFASPSSQREAINTSRQNADNTQEINNVSEDKSLKKNALNLWQELQDLNAEISNLKKQGYKIEELKWYIEKLHEYNEVKDVAQKIMGRIAEVEETTIKNIHERFGLTEDD